MGAAEAAAGACYDRNPVVKTYFAQGEPPVSYRSGRPQSWGRADRRLLGSLLNSHSVGSVNAPGRPVMVTFDR